MRMLAQASCRNASKPLTEIVVQDRRGACPAACPWASCRSRRCKAGRSRSCRPAARPAPARHRPCSSRRRTRSGDCRKSYKSPGCVTALTPSGGASSGSVSPPAARSADRARKSSEKPSKLQVKPVVAQPAPISIFSRLLVPAGIQRQLVVRQHIGALLRLVPTPLATPITGTSHGTPMPTPPSAWRDRRSTPIFVVDQNGVGPAELPDVDAVTCATCSAPNACAHCAHTGSASPSGAPGDREIVHSQDLTKELTNSRCFLRTGIQRFRRRAGGYPPREFRGHKQATARPVPAGRSRRQIRSPRSPYALRPSGPRVRSSRS